MVGQDHAVGACLARLSRIVAMLACGVGITFFVIGQALGLPFWQNFLFAIGIIAQSLVGNW